MEDKRQVPKDKQYIANNKYKDIVYAYLQVISDWDGVKGHSRTIPKKRIKWSRLETEIGITRQTVKKYFEQLKELGLILERGEFYELVILPQNLAMLIPYKTLRIMVNGLSDRAISAYTYLYSRYYANGEKEFEFSYLQMKSALGVSVTSKGNNYIVQDVLFLLEKLGLIEYRQELKKEGTEFKTIWILQRVNLDIDTPTYDEYQDRIS